MLTQRKVIKADKFPRQMIANSCRKLRITLFQPFIDVPIGLSALRMFVFHIQILNI